MHRNYLAFLAIFMVVGLIGFPNSPRIQRERALPAAQPAQLELTPDNKFLENSNSQTPDSEKSDNQDSSEQFAASQSEEPVLLASLSEEHSYNDPERPWAIRYRQVELDPDVLNGEVFSFAPFDGHRYQVVPERIEQNSEDNRSLFSHLVDDSGEYQGKAFITVIDEGAEKGFAGAFFLRDGRAFNLMHDEQGRTVVEEIQPGLLPIDANDGIAVPVTEEFAEVEEETDEVDEFSELDESDHEVELHGDHEVEEVELAGDSLGTSSFSGSSVIAADDSSAVGITFLALYTTQARTGAGGTAAIRARIQLSVNVTNQAYVDSGIDINLRLVHMQETTYKETSSFVTSLNRLTAPTDNYMDEAHTLRNQYGADLVGLLVQGMEYCGLAWLGRPSSAYASYGFSVTNQYCAPMYVLAHELGHNMGAHHDRNNASGGGAYSYSYGQHFNNNNFRTIMAYAPGTRVGHFSNPNVTYNGHATGVANMQDNARTLNNMAPIIAAYRGDKFTISGQVTYGNNLPLSGVVISAGSLGSATTDSNGNYSIRLVSGGSTYSLTLSRNGFGFTPVTGQTLTANATHNFVGYYTPQMSAISDRTMAKNPGEITIANLAAADSDTDAGSITFTASTHPYSAPYYYRHKLGLSKFRKVSTGVIFTGYSNKTYLLRTNNYLYSCTTSTCSKLSSTPVVKLFSSYLTNPAALINLSAPSGAISPSASVSGTTLTVNRNGYTKPFLVRVRAHDATSFSEKAFLVTVLNNAPAISSLSATTLSAPTETVTINATDADSDSLTYSVSFMKNAEALAYQFSKNYRLSSWYKNGYYVYYRSTLKTLYAINSRGDFFEVLKTGKFVKRGNVGSTYFKNPKSLLNKPMTYDHLVSFTINGNEISFDTNGFVGKVPITVRASDGTAAVTKNFTITAN